MNAAAVIAAAVGASTALLVGWVWVMNRLDERRERDEADRLRRAEPPVLGGAPRHLSGRSRRTYPATAPHPELKANKGTILNVPVVDGAGDRCDAAC